MIILICILIVFITLSIVFGVLFYSARKNYNRYVEDVVELLENNEKTIIKVKQDLTKERGRNKSVEVRTGFIVEKLAPFLKVFDEEPRNAHHLGSPIDYIVFNENEIVFVEVKSGKSRLSKKQRHIKRLVEENRVKFKTVVVDYE